MENFIYQLDQEVLLLHQSIVAVNEGLLCLDTALENETRVADALRIVRETTSYTITLVQGMYPIVGSVRDKLHMLGA
ncbi:hypothetical protein V8C37DRAFT_369281 [Trichoderma ceciliae]